MNCCQALAVLCLLPLMACSPSQEDQDELDSDAVDTEVETPAFALSEVEQELFDLINAYRIEEGLPAVPLSPSLSKVAQIHAADQSATWSGMPSQCNPHSWSDEGEWSDCCYTEDHAAAQCMWDKPAELTLYTGYGYEITHGAGSGGIDAARALQGWKGSPGHNAVILNLDGWERLPWGAMGVGVDSGFANVWFGEDLDPEGE